MTVCSDSVAWLALEKLVRWQREAFDFQGSLQQRDIHREIPLFDLDLLPDSRLQNQMPFINPAKKQHPAEDSLSLGHT
jgi:hypothetical protein